MDLVLAETHFDLAEVRAVAVAAREVAPRLPLGLSMTFTAIMMVALPAFIKYLGLPEVLGGAWIGAADRSG